MDNSLEPQEELKLQSDASRFNRFLQKIGAHKGFEAGELALIPIHVNGGKTFNLPKNRRNVTKEM